MTYKKIIFTIDIDAFFAQVEELKNPSLKNKPVVIGKKLNNKGIISTCNYKARKYGIHSGMPFYKATVLCPNLIFIEPTFSEYQEYSEKVFVICSQMSREIEPASIDEAYLDVTNKIINNRYIDYAKKIQDKILKEVGLTISIGISSNKELSKMASGMKKPFGVDTLFPEEISTKLWPLPIRRLYFVGNSTEKVMNDLNIVTIGDLANIPFDSKRYEEVKQVLGKRMSYLYNIANGNGSHELDTSHKDNKSVSYAKTYSVDMFNYDDVKSALSEIVEEVTWRAKYRRLAGKTITFTTKDAGPFNSNTKSLTFNKYSNDFEYIWSQVAKLLEKWWTDGKKVRFLSIALSNLVDENFIREQITIEDLSNINNDLNIERNEIIDDLNIKMGYEAFVIGEDYKNVKKFKDKRIISRRNVKFNTWSNKRKK